jgi:hypothetical protein
LRRTETRSRPIRRFDRRAPHAEDRAGLSPLAERGDEPLSVCYASAIPKITSEIFAADRDTGEFTCTAAPKKNDLPSWELMIEG